MNELWLSIDSLLIGIQSLKRVLIYRKATERTQYLMERVHGFNYLSELVYKYVYYKDAQLKTMIEQLEKELEARLDRACIYY